MTSHTNNDGHLSSGRERISQAAYELFSRDGTQSVGIDAVIAHAGAAKMLNQRRKPDVTRLGEDGVAFPAEIAEAQPERRMARGEQCFQMSRVQRSGHVCTANKRDDIARAQAESPIGPRR